MPKLVLVYHFERAMVAALSVFVLLTGLAFLGTLVSGEVTGAIICGAILCLFTAPIALEVYARRRYVGRARRFMKLIESIEDGVVRFKRLVRVKPSLLVSTGRWISTGRRSNYIYETFLEPLGDTLEADVLKVGGDYGIVIAPGGAGAVVLPALLVEEPGFEGVFLAFVPPQQPRFRRTTVEVTSPHGDYGVAHVEEGEGLRGWLEAPMLTKARGVRLELVAGLMGFNASKVVCKTRGPKTRFEQRLAPQETMVIIGHRRKFSPRAFEGKTGIRIAGTKPIYSLKLILDMPFAKDIVSEKSLEKLETEKSSG